MTTVKNLHAALAALAIIATSCLGRSSLLRRSCNRQRPEPATSALRKAATTAAAPATAPSSQLGGRAHRAADFRPR
jgi:hypothetical protein